MAVPLYMIDDENVSFQPQNVQEAIVLFNRMKRKKQVHWEYVPELLQKISAGLNSEDHDLFCEWICNPCSIKPGLPGYFASLCKDDKVKSEDSESEEQKVPDTLELSDHSPEDHTTVYGNSICTENACISDEQCIQSALP